MIAVIVPEKPAAPCVGSCIGMNALLARTDSGWLAVGRLLLLHSTNISQREFTKHHWACVHFAPLARKTRDSMEWGGIKGVWVGSGVGSEGLNR